MPHANARAAFIAVAAAFASSFLAAPASALIVVGGAGMDAPAHGFVGSWNGSTAVAVGDQWILTAAHVGGRVRGTFEMGGERYRGVERFVHESADLALVRIKGELSGWHAITGDVSRGDDILLAGAGRVAGETVRDGFAWSSEKALTWGANEVNSIRDGRIVFDYDGDRRGAHDFEAGFAMNDSGGGVFTLTDDGELLLAGIARGVSELGVTRRGSTSYAVLLADHLDWIASVIGEQADWRAGWLEEQALLASLSEVAVETPAPGAAAVLALAGVWSIRRRRSR